MGDQGLRCGPKGPEIPQMVKGGLEVWVMVSWSLSSPLPAKALCSAPNPQPKELWVPYETHKGVLQRSSGATQRLDLAP